MNRKVKGMYRAEFPFYLGYNKYRKELPGDEVICAHVYKKELKTVIDEDSGKPSERLDFKMKIDKGSLHFEKTEKGVSVWSKVDPGEHHKNETSIICTSEPGSLFDGEDWRGMILIED